MMKIGFDAKRLYNNFTGLGNYSRTLVNDLHTNYPEDELFLYSPKIRHTPETDFFLQNPELHTHLHPEAGGAYWRTFSIKKDLKRDGIELYHGLSHEIPAGTQRTSIKSVVTIHDIIYKTYPDMFTAIDRLIYDRKFRYSCKHADKIIAISECTKNDIIRYFGTPADKIEVIYQAINPVFYKMQDTEKARQTVAAYHIPEDFLLYVGSINSRKNLLSVIKAYALLPDDLQIPLVIIGKGGQYKDEVLKYAASRQLISKLILIDNLHDSETLQAFYQQAKLFVFPSVYEGFGLPVTEALLSKTPVITSNISSLPEAGGPAPVYVPPYDIEAIAESIKHILCDTTARTRMIEEGFQYAHQKFDPRTLCTHVHNLYKQLL